MKETITVGEEIWKDIIGFEGLYQISNLGRVKSLSRIKKSVSAKGKNYQYQQSDRILKNSKDLKGYFTARTKVGEKQVVFYIHRMIAVHFIENTRGVEFVNHINGIVSDNSISNLEWVTNRENVCHSKGKKNKHIDITYDKNLNKWLSRIYYNKKAVYLGVFENKEEAYLARVKFESDNGIINKYL